jgi:hypothetical protein
MIIGNPAKLAIESRVTKFYERLSFKALGCFMLHIGGHSYGRMEPDATMLACSFSEVERRIGARGRHTSHFATDPDAGKIADAFRDAAYDPNPEFEDCYFLGMPQEQLQQLFYARRLVWAPDGDEAFDDGSYVLQFDVGNSVRLIAFRSLRNAYHHDPLTLADVWMDSDEFYDVLRNWRGAFFAEWERSPKIREVDDQNPN